MGSRRWPHAIVVLVTAVGLRGGLSAQPSADDPLPIPKAGSGSAKVTPAGSSTVESNDVPVLSPSPARFAVTPFYNHSEAKAWDWLVAGAPFEIAEKTEEVLGLEPTGGPLQVGATMIEPEVEPVAAFGVERDAQWVITGWVDRPNWSLRIAATLWKVSGKGKAATAVVVAEAQRTGDPKTYHQLLGETVGQLWTKGAGIQVDLARQAKLVRSLANDVYAVNLMSRGLGYLIGVPSPIDLKKAEHDLERAVFIDPKCPEAQRLVGELYQVLATADPKLGGDPKFASRAAGKFAYVPCYDTANIHVIDLIGERIITTISVGESPQSVAISSDGERVYVVNLHSPEAMAIDTATNKVIATFTTGEGACGIAISPDGQRLYLGGHGVGMWVGKGEQNRDIRVIDARTFEQLFLIRCGIMPIAVKFSRDGKQAYVVSHGSGELHIIDTATNKATSVKVGTDCRDVVSTTDGKWVYVSNRGDNTVSVVDALAKKVIATIRVGKGPVCIALKEATGVQSR